MIKKIIVIIYLFPLIVFGQKDTIAAGAYNWKMPEIKKDKISSVILLKGKAHDFDLFQVSANILSGSKTIHQKNNDKLEELIIIKSGKCQLTIGDSVYLLTPKSLALLMPNQKFSIKNMGENNLEFYTIQYSKSNSVQTKTVANEDHSFVKIFEDQPFKPNKMGGGKRDFFEKQTDNQKRMDIHLSTLKEGLRSHDPHTHFAEEMVLMIDGDTEMQIGQGFVKVKEGGLYYLSSNVLHAIKNIGAKPCNYFAIQIE